MLHFIPLPELHLFVEFVECVTHPLILGSLKFLVLVGFRPHVCGIDLGVFPRVSIG
jgi:hypothetical protein